jgi:hypothetical protein
MKNILSVSAKPPSTSYTESGPMATLAQELREVSDDTAREEVAAYFTANTGQTLYYGDIAEALRLPLEQVVGSCQQLIQAGVIGIGEHS